MQQAYPDTSQVALLGLESSTDRDIWQYAREHGYTIVTRDADFEELAIVFGPPPQVIWLKTGNQSVAATLKVLLDHRTDIEDALLRKGQACVELMSR